MILVTNLKSKNKFWDCILCTSEMFPFCSVNSIMSLLKVNLTRSTGALISLMNQLCISLMTREKINSNCQTVNIEK